MMDQRSAPALTSSLRSSVQNSTYRPNQNEPAGNADVVDATACTRASIIVVANSRKSFCIVRNRARRPDHIERVTVTLAVERASRRNEIPRHSQKSASAKFEFW